MKSNSVFCMDGSTKGGVVEADKSDIYIIIIVSYESFSFTTNNKTIPHKPLL